MRRVYSFVGDGSYTFGNVAVSEANLPSINGTLHLLNGEVAYHPNIYEYIFQAPDRDSLANYSVIMNILFLMRQSQRSVLLSMVSRRTSIR
jgi:hypothetical protein